MQAEQQVLVMGHVARPKKNYETGDFVKDQDGNQVYDFKVKLGIAVGQPAVDAYVSEAKARELAEATGNSFQKGATFQPYQAMATFEGYVRSTTEKNSKYVNTGLALRLLDITFEGRSRKAA